MKINRKTVALSAGVLGAVALVAGGTIAYFTDYKTETNEFTIGKTVSINLYESQLHRQNSGRGGSFPALASDVDYCDWNASSSVTSTFGNPTLINGSYENARYCTPNMDAGNTEGITAVANHHTAPNRYWGYSDQTIIDDSETYNAAATTAAPSGYFSRASEKIVPGQWVRKFSYVKNSDESNSAYVMIRYMVPIEYADVVDLKLPGTPYEEDTNTSLDGIQAYFQALDRNSTNGTYSAHALTEDANGKMVIDDPTYGYKGYTYTDPSTNQTYKVYAAVTTQPVDAGEMTFWSPINTVRLSTDVEDSDVANLDDFGIKVEAEAIQSKPFADAVDAVNHL